MKPFGLADPAKVKPGSMKTISQAKLATFVVGQQKKTRFQKEKEAKEAKKKQELTEAAGLYQDFVSSFNPEENSKTFIRGSQSNRDDRSYKMQGPSSSSSRPSIAGGAGSKKPISEMERMLEEMKEQEAMKNNRSSSSSSSSRSSSGSSGASSGGFSNGPPTVGMMAIGNAMIPVIDTKGSHDDGGGDSTNLYVGNLAPCTTEETLNEIFSKFGEIYSVKIMWPRTEEEKARKRNCGFVSFMQRGDAADAKDAMHNADIDGHSITVGWGKAIKKLSNNPTMLGQAGGFLKVREDALQPGLAPEVHDKLSSAVQAAKDAALNAAKGLDLTQGGAPNATTSTPATGGGGMSDFLTALVKDTAATTSTNEETASTSTTASTPTTTTGNKSGKVSKWDAKPEDAVNTLTSSTSVPTSNITEPGNQMMEKALLEANKLKQSNSKWDEVPNPVPVERDMTLEDEQILVEVPKSIEVKELIDRLARYISKDGQPLENMIREREAANPKYDCLNNPTSSDAIYYRWKVYSLCMGDKEDSWREKPFQISPNAPFWVPPKMPKRRSRSRSNEKKLDSREKEKLRLKEREEMRKERYKFSTGAQLEKARDRQERDKKAQVDVNKGRPLSDRAYDRFQEKLRTLTSSRRRIKEAMGFAYDYADSSGDIIDLLEGSLLVNETPINVKIARLYLLSDILHNSSVSVKHASTYRTLLQNSLPKIMEHLNATLRNPELGRITAKNLEEKVMFLLKVWEQWSIYPPIFLGGLEASFQRKNNDLEDDLLALQKGVMDGSTLDVESLVRKAKYNGIYYDPEKDDPMRLFKKLAFAEEYIRIKESPPEVLENELENSSADSLLGINPAPAWQIGGGHMQPAPSSPPTQPTSSPSTSVTTKAVGQWDAVEDDEEEEVDGVAMEEEDDVDGVAMNTVAPSSQSSKKRKSENTLGSSRFSDESEGEDDEDVDGVALDDDTFFNQPPTTSSSEQETPSSSHMSREVIREIEGKILKYRDELESSESGTYSTNEIDKLCSEKRQTLIQEQESSQQGHEYKKQRK